MSHRSISILVGFAAALLLAASPVGAGEMSVSPDRQAIEQIIHDYLMAHPEVVIESLRAGDARIKEHEAEESRAQIVKHQDDLVRDTKSPVGGNPAGDVTIVEFFDYRCPYCKQVEPALEALLKEDRQLRIVYKELPILGKDSVYATRAALAARKQGKYDKFHTAMMAAKGQIDEKSILQVAAAAGLDIERLKSDMTASEIDDAIKRNYDLAQALDIHGTPAFVI